MNSSLSRPAPDPTADAASASDLPPTTRREALWRGLKTAGISSLTDTLHSGRHSRDFTLARNDYLRSRVLVAGVLFAILTPLWLIVDGWLLPQAALAFVTSGRLFLLGGLAFTLLLACRSRGYRYRARIATLLLILLPAAFYGLVLLSLPPSQMHLLLGYSFIPYLLVATLAIFPLTLSESAIAGIGLILLECFAQQQAGTWLTPAGWQGLWLMSVLLLISMTANYFHLGLLLRLYRQATHDTLTGLLNRRALQQTLRQLRDRHPDRPYGVLMLDIDHFKRLNDEHGHAFGDRVLRHLAAVLQREVPPPGLTSRFGGEEFLVIVPFHLSADLHRQGERLRRAVAELNLHDFDGQSTPVTVSIGAAALHPDENLDIALRRADSRLYRAKQTGRNQVVAEG